MGVREFLDMAGLTYSVWRVMFTLGLDETHGGKAKEVKSFESCYKAKEYFSSHPGVENEISKLLSDDLSKDVYLKMVQYRQNMKGKYLPRYSHKDQYFPEDIVSIGKNEVFIDCGASFGDTIQGFLKKSGGVYDSIVAFEPDTDSYHRLKTYTNSEDIKKDLYIHNAGVWSESTELSFIYDARSSHVVEGGKAKIKVFAIDDLDECQNASFIKMDVEGSEREALKGAHYTIEKNRPIMAICIYHSSEDMVEIPRWIHDNFPFYKLYVRQHSFLPVETVLYCIPH